MLILLQVVPLLVFRINYSLILLLLILTGINIFIFYAEGKVLRLNLFRFSSLLVLIIILSVFSSPLFQLKVNRGIISLLQSFSGVSILFNILTEANLKAANIVFAGAIFLLNEVNFLIRFLFELFDVIPKLEEQTSEIVDKKEYNTGRVIGMLERIIIFFFVLINQFAAIGFIIAAKGFTRFKELDKREFAEYVLIGTLLSSLLAILVSLMIRSLISSLYV